MILNVHLILNSIPRMLAGMGITLQLLFLASVLGLALAIALLLMRISGRWHLSFPAFVYAYFFRGIPILGAVYPCIRLLFSGSTEIYLTGRFFGRRRR